MLNLSLGCRITFGPRNTFTKIVLIPLNRNVQTKRLHVDSIVNQEIRNWSVIFQHSTIAILATPFILSTENKINSP